MPKTYTMAEKQQIESTILGEYKRILETCPNSKISVNQLAQKAGIAKGTFYLFFSDKEALFVRVVMDVLDEVSAFIEEQDRLHDNSLAFFVAVLTGFARYVEAHMWLVQVSGREFTLAQSQLSDEGRVRLLTKKEQLWNGFLGRLGSDLTVSREMAMDAISVLLLSNASRGEMFDFGSSYGHLVRVIGESILR